MANPLPEPASLEFFLSAMCNIFLSAFVFILSLAPIIIVAYLAERLAYHGPFGLHRPLTAVKKNPELTGLLMALLGLCHAFAMIFMFVLYADQGVFPPLYWFPLYSGAGMCMVAGAAWLGAVVMWVPWKMLSGGPAEKGSSVEMNENRIKLDTNKAE